MVIITDLTCQANGCESFNFLVWIGLPGLSIYTRPMVQMVGCLSGLAFGRAFWIAVQWYRAM